ncbi:hypothetical protein EYZ11_008098 [Aspergillus tanneri]|uniref:Uncharacterized protein n=1 Tax=Aspergillus tanneri TaxID=1220188 RepID=A0A4S3JBM9_9EURO|nr:hypothetical protein EYZ11_008098 [Aspergillus tanneri]
MASTFKCWADHGAKPGSVGSIAHEIFEFIAQKDREGARITFVWLDNKNPCFCAPGWGCSIEALRYLARETLQTRQPVGMRALYGFYGVESSQSGDQAEGDG